MACVLLPSGVYTLVKWHRAHFWLFPRTWIFAEALFVFLWERVKPVCLALRPVLGFFLSCTFRLLCGPSTHSAILFPSSRLGGCELAVKRTRPPLVWFMSLDCWPLLSSHSGSGSLGTHAALSPSCSEKEGHTSVPLQCCRLMYVKVQVTTSCLHRVLLFDTADAWVLFFFFDTMLYHCIWSISANTTGIWCWMYSKYL